MASKVQERRPVGGLDYPRNWSEFHMWFPDDVACLRYLCALRWPDGFECPRCGHYGGWLTGRGLYVCSGCRAQTSPTAGTIFHGTRTPLPVWVAAMWYVTNQKNGVSALGLSRVLGIEYKTAWTWLHKLRRAMVRPDRELLGGDVEVDETYVGGSEQGLRGRQTVKKSIVVIAVEVQQPKGFGRVRLQRVPNVAGDTLEEFVASVVCRDATVLTDMWGGYNGLGRLGYAHKAVSLNQSPDPAHVHLPGVHRVASLLKRWLNGTHQGSASPHHLDYYLDEYTFRFNRRTSKARGLLFYRLLQQTLRTDPHPLKDLIGGKAAGPRPAVE